MPHPKFLVAGAIMLGAIAYLMFSGIEGSMVYYHTVSEVTDRAEQLQGKGLRLSGVVAEGSIERNDPLARVDFQVLEPETGRTLPVRFHGVIPDTFKDGAQVVVEGYYDLSLNRFEANTLLAKCPSKYEAEGLEEYGEEDATAAGSGE